MQTTKLHRRLNYSIIPMTVFLIMSLTGVCQADEKAIAELALLDVADKWQMNRLLEPSEKQRSSEAQGQIMIYDGLRDTAVNHALDSNFDRIENMMFTRVVVTDQSGKPRLDETGNEVVEDDGC